MHLARRASKMRKMLEWPGAEYQYQTVSGGDIVAATLKRFGITTVFTLIGGHITPMVVACRREGMRVIDVRHEASTVFAADALARLTGLPGVAFVTAGPGVTNTITALKNAQMAETPLLLFGGAVASVLVGRGALQDVDQLSIVKPLCKKCFAIDRVCDIRSAVEVSEIYISHTILHFLVLF